MRGIPSTQLAAACRGFLLPHEVSILSLSLLEVRPIPLELLGPNASPSLVLLVSCRVPGWNAATATAPSLWLLTIGLWSEVAQSCLTLCDPMNCSLPGSSVHGIIQAPILEWVAISISRKSSYLSLLFEILHSVGYIFPFHLCLWLLFLAICKASDNHPIFLDFFFLGMVLVTTSYTMLGTSIQDLIPWIYSSPPLFDPLYPHKTKSSLPYKPFTYLPKDLVLTMPIIPKECLCLTLVRKSLYKWEGGDDDGKDYRAKRICRHFVCIGLRISIELQVVILFLSQLFSFAFPRWFHWKAMTNYDLSFLLEP